MAVRWGEGGGSDPSGRFGAVAMVGRAELRQRWLVVVAVGLLLGVAGGIGIGCLAGARRTSTLFHRHLEASRAPDIEIDPGTATRAADRAIRTLPGVATARYWVVSSMFPVDAHGAAKATKDLGLRDLIAFTSDGRYLDLDRVATSRGRRLDPTRPDEIMVNQAYLDLTGEHVGSTVRLGRFRTDEDGTPLHPEKAERVVTTRIVGVMVINEEIASETIDVVPRLFVSPALKPADVSDRRYFGYSWYALKLKPGASVAAVEQRWSDLAAAHNARLPKHEEGWLTFVHRSSDLQRKASRAVRPLATTIAAFGVAALLAAVVLAAQALGRQVRSRREPMAVGRILGLTPRDAFLASMVVPGLALVLAAVVASLTAMLLSLVFPIGPFEVLEPNPGLDLDLVVLVPLLLVLVLVPLALVVVTAARVVRGSSFGSSDAAPRPSRLAALVSRSGRSPVRAAAFRLTFEPGTGQSYVPTRSVQVSSIIAVVAMVTIVVFGHNLDAVDRDPVRFGWNADALMVSDGGYSPFNAAKLHTFVSRREITRWRLAATGQVTVRGTKVPGALFGPGDSRFRPTMLAGRPPARAGEAVFGAATLHTLRAKVGDRLPVGSGDHRASLLVTGTAVFPVMGPVLAVRTSLDHGVWLDRHDYRQLDSVASYLTYGLPVSSIYNSVFLGLRPGTSTVALQREARRRVSELSYGSSVDLAGVVRPSEVRTAAAAGGRSQVLLAGVLAVSAGLSILFALSAVVRRRRSELAVYRVLGFTPGQVRRTLLLQGVILLGVSVVIGVPIGIGLGRTLWRAFATRLGVVPDPVLPVPLVLGIAAVSMLLGVLGSLGPAVVAARVAPAVAVRAE